MVEENETRFVTRPVAMLATAEKLPVAVRVVGYIEDRRTSIEGVLRGAEPRTIADSVFAVRWTVSSFARAPLP